MGLTTAASADISALKPLDKICALLSRPLHSYHEFVAALVQESR